MWSDHIKYICDRVEAKLNDMKFKLLRNSNIESQVKIIVWNNVFKPILMYAAEIWWGDKSQIELLERLQLKVCKWIIGCSSKTVSDVVRNELGVGKLEHQMIIAKLKWFGLTRVGKNRLVDEVAVFESKFVGRRRTWNQIIAEGIHRYNLTELLVWLDNGLISVDQWGEKVKERSERVESEEWRYSISSMTKCRLYTKVELRDLSGRFTEHKWQKVVKPYLRLITEQSRLKFKFLSGTSGLNEEKGRQLGEGERRQCECCAMEGEEGIESVCHLLIVCPRYKEIRDKFIHELLSREYQNFNIEWTNANNIEKCVLLLSDYEKQLHSLNLNDQSQQNDHIVNETRVFSGLIDDYILSVWNVRNLFLFGAPKSSKQLGEAEVGVCSTLDLTTN